MLKKIAKTIFSLYIAFNLSFFSSFIHGKTFTSIKQLSDSDRPLSYSANQQIPSSPVYSAKSFNTTKLAKEDEFRLKNRMPYRFAVPVADEDLTTSGQWHTVDDQAIWRLTISAAKAKSINFGLKNVVLPEGAKLFFYTDNYQTIIGPYTKNDINGHQQIWSPLLESTSATLEINVPLQQKPLISFNIAKVSQGYRGIRSSELKSGSCNIDVICSEGDAWRNEIRSVARYQITGEFLCSGTLINNVEGSRRPFFLTAQHCGINQETSPSMVFYWNYEVSVCSGNRDGQLNQFQNGASFRSIWFDSDLALVELDEIPNTNFNVYWSGWSNSSAAPSSAVSIHHPMGDEKAISIDDDPLTITNYEETAVNINGTHLRVGSWDSGTTEGGSSGSGLWNQNGRLVGTLTGGFASCAATNESDWYGRMSLHWDGNPSRVAQVKFWLDPNDLDPTTMNGANNCNAPDVDINPVTSPSNLGTTFNLSATVSGGSGSYNYFWDFNDDGITDSTDISPSFNYSFLYEGKIRLTVVDSNNCAGVDTIPLMISNNGNELLPSGDQVSNSLTPDNLPAWQVDNTEVFQGNISLRAANISDDEISSIEITETFNNAPNNRIGFAVKVSSEADFDFINFYINDELMGSWSGEIDWITLSYFLENGTHRLRWSYEKDESISEGDDTAWIDSVTGVDIEVSSINRGDSGGGLFSRILLLLLISIAIIRQIYKRQSL